MESRVLPALVARVRRTAARRDAAGVPDADLVARWAAGRDEAAFELLVWRHGSMVLATCRRILGPGPDADDAFQATFLTLVRKAGRIRVGSQVGGWLHRVAYRVALRVRARRPAFAPLAADPPGRPAADPNWADVRAALDQEINALPERYRLPFVLCHLEGKTNAEAARDLGRPVGTIESRLSTARRRLRVRLRRRGITLSVVAAASLPLPLARAAAGLARGTAPSHLVSLCPKGVLPMSLTLKIAAAVLTTAVLVAVPGSADPPKNAVKDKPAPAATPPATPEDPMKPGLPKGWWGGPFGEGEYVIGLDSKTFKSGKAAAFIRADKPGNGATLTQMVAPAELKGKRVRLSAQVKTKGTDPGAGLWMRIDTPDGPAGFDNMADRMIAGDTDWKTHAVVLEVPEKATAIAFGAILFGGQGTVWIDDVNLEAVGKDVKLTAEPTEPAGDGVPTSEELPEKPTNLGFEDGQREQLRVVPTPLTEAETGWLKKAAVPLAGVEAGRGFKDLEPLKAVFGDARIVALGESTHGTREHFRMKHRLLEFLVTEMGFTHFAIEANMTEAFRVNEYVLHGTGNAKEALAGLYFWTWYTEEVLAMIEWMREFNKSGKGKVQFLGFDMQTGTVAQAGAKAFIAKADPAFVKEADELYKKAAPLLPDGPAGYQALEVMKGGEKKERADAAWAVVAHLEKNRDRYLKAMTAEEVDRGILDATVAAQAARNAAATHNYRDESMAANVGWILDHAPKGSKVVLWAHNGHVGRTEGSMGEHLARRYGKEMVVVGFGTGEGKYTAIRPGVGLSGANELKTPPAGSLEKACRDAGLTDFALDLRPSATEPAAKWLARPHLFRSIGALAMENQFQPRVVPAEFDVLIYIDKTTASKCFGFAPAPGAKD
jgi:erythromycin esterase